MTKFTNSQPFRARYQEAPYTPSPARREFIHGPVRGLPNVDRTAPWFMWTGFAIAMYFVAALVMGAAQ